MKRLLPFSLLLAALTLGSCKSAEQRAADRLATEHYVAQAIGQRHLTIDIRSMDSQRYGSRNNLNGFSLELRGDTVVSNLPYLGRAYRAPYRSVPMGLNFTAPVQRFAMEALKKNVTRMTFIAETDEDRYQYSIDIFPQGRCYIMVRPQERDMISFDGELR